MAQMRNKPQSHQKHPDQWQQDLNPDELYRANIGQNSVSEMTGKHYAADFKDLVNLLHDEFTFNELQQIPIVPEGTPLKEEAVYVNLKDSARYPFQVHDKMYAEEGKRYVPKKEVAYELWNRLVGEARRSEREQR